ncbi:MAG: hypothetical protein A2408_03380 [Candidatus Yonathbacteria bacterium RIFOXYC1_FULL_52_10]|uniref:Uncharacterized protein n=1 Tax=Candidatus Yonathbacteria bacterium RIFOXYD1_FULL_52_36 TaxID=1802730 RepID=A0A1G2SKX2_9BACT|nr:MAG: hypothetical protein A2408_03380 [Candidatus Yonathbacteria bacterium RIFOXYC1_FULL_52_10]OHA85735.1 MAG: hypothetical protein A2591_02160 [Candidatus Yonathbacteria bacterium RIFOXYD1_FULL_52_36]
MNEHVIRVIVDGIIYSVLARRELLEGDKPCFECGKVAADVKLVAVSIYRKMAKVTDDGIRRVVEEAMKKQPFAQPVCGSPHCYGVFLGKINPSDEQPYQYLRIA